MIFGNTSIPKYSSSNDTLEHKSHVKENMRILIDELILRATTHDDSKLKSPEKEIFDEYTPKLKNSTYMSDEYKDFLKEMNVALDHHYKHNPHHPEYHDDGILGMTLVDLVEMICDWKAASMRHSNGDIKESIKCNKDRFGYSSELE